MLLLTNSEVHDEVHIWESIVHLAIKNVQLSNDKQIERGAPCFVTKYLVVVGGVVIDRTVVAHVVEHK